MSRKIKTAHRPIGAIARRLDPIANTAAVSLSDLAVRPVRRDLRAVIIRSKILKHENSRWEFEQNAGTNTAVIVHERWHAVIQGRSTVGMLNTHMQVGPDIFLDACRRLICSHTLDVWADGYEKVLSLECGRGGITLIALTRGTWETYCFGLPSPKSKSSPYYTDRLP